MATNVATTGITWLLNLLRSPITFSQFVVDFIALAFISGFITFLVALAIPVSYGVAAIVITVFALAGASWLKWGPKPAAAATPVTAPVVTSTPAIMPVGVAPSVAAPAVAAK